MRLNAEQQGNRKYSYLTLQSVVFKINKNNLDLYFNYVNLEKVQFKYKHIPSHRLTFRRLNTSLDLTLSNGSSATVILTSGPDHLTDFGQAFI